MSKFICKHKDVCLCLKCAKQQCKKESCKDCRVLGFSVASTIENCEDYEKRAKGELV